MNSLVRVFSNFKEFYNEINGATLTGAIDVIVVEQPNGEYQCSPFHVRFGKLGVLRSREKVVDIEINGEPVDIHMKLGESGEAFFVEELLEDDVEELPDNLATSPIPSTNFPSKYTDEILDDENSDEGRKIASDNLHQLPLPLPRRNSIDFSKESTKDPDTETKFENQISDYSHRRHTDNTLERRNLTEKLKEYTTMKIRQEWAEHEEIFQFDPIDKDKDWSNSTQNEDKQAKDKPELIKPELEDAVQISETSIVVDVPAVEADATLVNPEIEIPNNTKDSTLVETIEANHLDNKQDTTSVNNSVKEESKSKKKRRKKSLMKKKNAQRKSSSSSSVGSNAPLEGTETPSVVPPPGTENNDSNSASISNNTISTSNEDYSPLKSTDAQSAALLTANCDDESPINDTCQTQPIIPSSRIPELDIHFFSDTEITTSGGPNNNLRGAGRPSTPIQSDSELEISLRGKESDADLMSSSASWKWGELPTPEHSDGNDRSGNPSNSKTQAQRNSMLSGMFNFMRTTNKIRQQADGSGGIYLSDLDSLSRNPEMAALYFPDNAIPKEETSPASAALQEDDRESGNGTSLPHSPSSLEGQKSLDSDYEDGGKPSDGKYLDFVAMSLCGVNEKGDPSDEEFDRHLVKYSDVCENPTIFSSPNLVVRLNGKYYSWAAACPIVMTIITFKKPLTDDVIEQITASANKDAAAAMKSQVDGGNTSATTAGQQRRSWWNWRRSQNGPQAPNLKPSEQKPEKLDEKDGETTAVATTQTTRPNSPDFSENTLSKTESMINAENTSAMVENFDELSQSSSKNDVLSSSSNQNGKNERYKKSLRLSSDVIQKLKLNDGMNEVEFSVTTAYQGTTRCKCYLFKWKHNDKVVISDIDGTITKSDVLGHILPMVGKDWAQLGVAQLFSKIEQNGYKLLYLSARAIGQSRATREYLKSIRQGDVKLPEGPLLLNPTSLISAFHREVIERKPEQFKIACLSDIRDLFPEKNPFYAGYGNRINDVWAYTAVGIPIMRIFTINTKGELKHELTQTFQSSYSSMTYIVDQIFPPLKPDETANEYSSFNYWRDPIADIDLDVIDGITPKPKVEFSKSLTTIPEN